MIRDADGFVAAAGCWYMPILPDSDVAEAMALLKGLQFAKDLSIILECTGRVRFKECDYGN